ncbi:phage portal protein [Paenibacillus harenae]|uniref:DUF3168 domain-containing protein n=1 Tax=Paenibacillus harenae TaxID=306543 RepID=A0ABT9TZ95_PAEHA|nr:phage portal protein [Paenibacillus harenae]MDQ0060117.1 hypothetical protein [Paenibacillus harenae]MDQ0112332.1 hypothetical protein [Paenibacillus harenae]
MLADIVSIAAFCGELVSAQVYIGDVPEQKTIPALAFPPPRIVDSPGTVTSSFRKTYTLVVRIFQETDSLAFAAAESIADGIRFPRYRIPLLGEGGAATGDFIRIDQLELQMAGAGEANLTLVWSRQLSYERETYQKVNQLTIVERVKSDA